MELQNDLLSLETDFSWCKELDFQEKYQQLPSQIKNQIVKQSLEISSQNKNNKFLDINVQENNMEQYLIKFGIQRLLQDFGQTQLEKPLEEKEFDLQNLYEEDNMSTNECSAELMHLKQYQQNNYNDNDADTIVEKQETQKINAHEQIPKIEEEVEESEYSNSSEYTQTNENQQQQYQKQTPQQYQEEINQLNLQQYQEEINQLNLQQQQQEQKLIIQQQKEQTQSVSQLSDTKQNQLQIQQNQQQFFYEESEMFQSEEMATTTQNINSLSCNPTSYNNDSIIQQQIAINQQNLLQESSSLAITEQQSQVQNSTSSEFQIEDSSEYVPQNKNYMRKSQRTNQKKKQYVKKDKTNKQSDLQNKKQSKKSLKQNNTPVIQNKAIKKRDITLNYKNKRSSEETKNLPTTIGKILLKSLKDHLPDIQELQQMQAISNKDHFQQLFKISPVVQQYSIDFLTKGPMMAYLASSTRLKQKRLVIKYIDIIVEGAIDPYNFKCFKQQVSY